MPKAPENRIGQIFNRWKIIEELPRGKAIDRGILREKTRFFKVECTKCGWVKDSVSYKNIYYDKISHPECKTDWELEHETMMNGKYGRNIVNKVITNQYRVQFDVLGVKIPHNGQYKFKTLIYTLKCKTCGAKKDNILHQQVANKDFNFCKCKDALKGAKQTREEIIRDIDAEFELMLLLHRENQLINYLQQKFPEECWQKILQDED